MRALWVAAGLLACALVAPAYDSSLPDHFPKFLKTGKYGQAFSARDVEGLKTAAKTDGRKTFTKTSFSKTSGAGRGGGGGLGSYGAGLAAKSHAAQEGGGITYAGGCKQMPATPGNSALRCSQYSGCRATCAPGHQFPNGEAQLYLKCRAGEWRTEGADWDPVPPCAPVCVPECQNSGICYAPNQCNCADNFSGPQCQFERRPCLNYPALAQNARRTCSSTQCTVTCLPGHQFPDGSAIATLQCREGQWAVARRDWPALPDCQPTCAPPCANGGVCLALNVCQCPQDFRGPQCQFKADACAVRRLGFNGGYNCSGDADALSCSLRCPDGVAFSAEPAARYTCRYAEGRFEPQPVPQCVYAEGTRLVAGAADHAYTSGLNYSRYSYESGAAREADTEVRKLTTSTGLTELMLVQQRLPTGGSCVTWGGAHYKTFDGLVYSAASPCAHTLVRDAADDTFSVVVRDSVGCRDATAPVSCHREVRVYLQDRVYTLRRGKGDVPELLAGVGVKAKSLGLPAQAPGLRAELVAHHVLVSLDALGLSLRWEAGGGRALHVHATPALWNRTAGLCGRLDGDPANDAATPEGAVPQRRATLLASWRAQGPEDEECAEEASEAPPYTEDAALAARAQKTCARMLGAKRFGACSAAVEAARLLDACRWDYAACARSGRAAPEQCACDTLGVYVRECRHKGVPIARWRDENMCPMECSGGRVYRACGPAGGQPACGATTVEVGVEEDNELEGAGRCEEGCYCPAGLVLHEGACVAREQCPCRLRGQSFAPGRSVPRDCNTCTCAAGEWRCTEAACGARCAAVGDPHYRTFDGRRYDFQGQCAYYLLRAANLSVEAENVACSGAISAAMGLPAGVARGLPSCTRSVTVRTRAGHVVQLRQGGEVTVAGRPVTRLPLQLPGGDSVRAASSMFTVVELADGLQVWWDGQTRVYVDAPARYRGGDARGLCGSFNANQQDDFATPEGDVEAAAAPFANKWKVDERCADVPVDAHATHTCDVHAERRAGAEARCGVLRGELFRACHWLADPEPFYQACLYDVCACEAPGAAGRAACLCPALAAYAQECADRGAVLQWRAEVRECGVRCPGAQRYQACADPCARSCADIAAASPHCRHGACVEGCNCPPGQALDALGECIPVGQCPCRHDGVEFPPGYKEIRPATRAQELHTCTNGVWEKRVATEEEVAKYPSAGDLRAVCSAANNQEFTTCEPTAPTTCRNMHEQPTTVTETGVCRPGCRCKAGYVLLGGAEAGGRCVRAAECPCHHGGRSYGEGARVQSDCNTCACAAGRWNCTARACAGVCSVWGDSHYRTFDGRAFDFQGQCDYVLAKGALGRHDAFDVSVQAEPCGALGVACARALTVTAGGEALTLARGRPLPSAAGLRRLALRPAHSLVAVELAELGVSVLWDRGTRVYVRLDPRWRGRVKGLCGNFNGDQQDDFQTPAGGFSEESARLFGDSWRLQPYCPEAPAAPLDACAERPERRAWARRQCGALKRAPFAACHAQVPVQPFLERCTFDACACDQGGDCECLCTALAAYAYECSMLGVPIRWRTPDLCPMQCDEQCFRYSECVSTCPVETCDSAAAAGGGGARLCGEEPCVEGCAPRPCPAGHVHRNASALECVPRATCRPTCLELDGVLYAEGDVMEEDACHRCHCSRHTRVCTGKPCADTAKPPPALLDQALQCRAGWTPWLNQDRASGGAKGRLAGGKRADVEPLPSALVLLALPADAAPGDGPGRCNVSQMWDVQCRTVDGHIDPKATGLDVECSLERGLVCKADRQRRLLCPDFEMRVLCRCDAPEAEAEAAPARPGEPVCDVAVPTRPHPADCHAFFQCADAAGGPQLLEKTCGPDMLYNPAAMVCDWPDAVLLVRPECERLAAAAANKKPPPKHKRPESEDLLLEPGPSVCPEGFVYSPCAVECGRLCGWYAGEVRARGACLRGEACEEGCVPAARALSCPPGERWRDNGTCVAPAECTCRAHDGAAVRPGTVRREGACELCQCIADHYACDRSACEADVDAGGKHAAAVTMQWTEELLLQFVTGLPMDTPPERCAPERFGPLVDGAEPLADQALSASSERSAASGAAHARLSSHVTDTSAGSWSPAADDRRQHLQVDLGRAEPVYGAVLAGSPLYDEYVTSYFVAYSPTADTSAAAFRPVVTHGGAPQLFRGPVDQHTPVRQMFDVPVEARVLRVLPQSWHNGISVRLDLVGCMDLTTSTAPTTTHEVVTMPPEYEIVLTTTPRPGDGGEEMSCDQPMGVDGGLLPLGRVSVSSARSPAQGVAALRLRGPEAWRPLANSPAEWAAFDFGAPRNVTGVRTRGGPAGWVGAYRVRYSHDGHHWNPLLDDYGAERLFAANWDQDTPHTNSFPRPLRTQHLRVLPVKWTNNIQMRAEPLGCFEPYPEEETTTYEPGVSTEETPCNVCPGAPVPPLETAECVCEGTRWWDGAACTSRAQCPCVEGAALLYPVGAAFERADAACSQCLCTLGGVAQCAPKRCGPCAPGLLAAVTATCACECRPCPAGQRLCPTSNICLNETAWCNGVVECPDDELDCAATLEPPARPTKVPVVEAAAARCPAVHCPPGYRAVLRQASRHEQLHSNLSPMFTMYGGRAAPPPAKGAGAATKGGYQGARGLPRRPPAAAAAGGKGRAAPPPGCPEYRCVSVRPPPDFPTLGAAACPPPACPPAYTVLFDNTTRAAEPCPRYQCRPPPVQDAVCNVTGRSFTTFDGTDFQLDVCNHVLARDLYANEWDISLVKNCTGVCRRELVVRHGEETVRMFSDLSLEYNGFRYSVEQTKKIGARSRAFVVSRLGDTLLFVSNHYGFWVMWERAGGVRVGVTAKLRGQVDGLCGLFDGRADNDRRRPDGKPARTTEEFGASWALGDAPCEPRACPLHAQNRAWQMCNAVRDQALAPCRHHVDLDAWVARCLDTACTCLEQAPVNDSDTSERCRCAALEAFVVECTAASASEGGPHLEDWRVALECPAACPAPLVHRDCFRRRCEPSCATLAEPDACPTLPNVCFAGCFCPPGLVRKKEACVPPRQCRDCECNVLPHLEYVSFDGAHHTADTNCTYVMARSTPDVADARNAFALYVSNAPCARNPAQMCPAALTLLLGEHRVVLERGADGERLQATVDDAELLQLPFTNDWVEVTQLPARHLNVLVPRVQLELRAYYPTLGASLKVPSHAYGGRMEGLCGDCDRDPDNEVPADESAFVRSWLANETDSVPPSEDCVGPATEECAPVLDADGEDPCLLLLDAARFGQCHLLLDPAIFLATCRHDTCGGGAELACASLETYALGCRAQGVCVHWRPALCPAPRCPEGAALEECGPPCARSCERPEGCKGGVPTEACHCGAGLVLKNGTCVAERECAACDDAGHYAGDAWAVDACTRCACDVETRAVRCETRQCPALATVCERGFSAVRLPRGPRECCERYVCAPDATDASPTCDAPQPLACGHGQVMKLDRRADGCQQFICQCKPADECDPVDDVVDEVTLEPGVERVVNRSGCCPAVELVCRPERCPAAPACRTFYRSVEHAAAPGRCCPTYTCEPPADRCVHTHAWTAADRGGERARTAEEREVVALAVGAMWAEGPCRACQCVAGAAGEPPRATCTATECPALRDHPDQLDYVLEEEWAHGQCCPGVRRAACRHEGATHAAGAAWRLDGDPCTRVECADTAAGLAQRTRVQTCDTHCDPGAEYRPAPPASQRCCGECHQVACAVNGELQPVGARWTSPDHCTEYTCANVNGTIQVSSVVTTCANVSEEARQEFVFEYEAVEGACCGRHVARACLVRGEERRVGETWPDPDGDPCVSVSCLHASAADGDLVQQRTVRTCATECPVGWRLQPPAAGRCCGECVQVACVVDGGELREPGATWASADGCTHYECTAALAVASSQETCPDVGACPAAALFADGCCTRCNETALALALHADACRPQARPAADTVGLVRQERLAHGACRNRQPLAGFTECRGHCDSHTLYNAEAGAFEARCWCCQALEYTRLDVTLTCDDGYNFQKPVSVPSACSCKSCSALDTAKRSSFTKT